MEKQRCNIHKGIHLYMTYIYIETERERERERERWRESGTAWRGDFVPFCIIYIYIYTYIYIDVCMYPTYVPCSACGLEWRA